MHFKETEIIQEIRGLARQFARNKLAPVIEEDERTETFRPEFIAQLGALGLAGISTPETYGGSGLGTLEYTAAIEEIARVSAGYAVSIAVSGLPQAILSRFGSEEQKKKYIPPLATGKAIGAFSLSEAGSGSDAGSLRAKATRKGNSYILEGSKLWCTQGDSASTIIVMARTADEGANGVSAFIVEAGPETKTKGFRVGKRERKMGCHISHTMEILFENCEIPAENRVGAEGEGLKIALYALDGGRITIGATACGIAGAALDQALSHAGVREQFGKPIGAYQGVSFMLADMATELEAARLLVLRAAWMKDQGLPFTTQAAMAKLFSTDAAMRITTDAVQILGGSGYTMDFPVERYMREAKVLQIVEGTNQIQRMVIGRALTGLSNA